MRVPESNRVLNGPMGSAANAGNYGAFIIQSCEPGWMLALVCDDGKETGWEHVSVRAFTKSNNSRIPTWKEMCQVKDLCWQSNETVMQLHPAATEYVNIHPHVLHLWKPINFSIPVPPKELV